MQTIVIKNTQGAPTGGVELIKVDGCDRAHRLAGARFDLLRSETPGGACCPVLRGLETSRQGALRVTDLPPGHYRFVEVSPPPGYRLAGGGAAFQIREDGSADRPVIVLANCRACRACPPCPPCRRCTCCCGCCR